jgi:hypothetical protein
MFVKTTSTFVYGRFIWPARKRPMPPVPGTEDIAIEILREYSSTELVGKLYERRASVDWVPISPARASSNGWWKWFEQAQSRLYFEMEGSGYWEVVNFRNESDDTGPYVAVALRYRPRSPLPKWVALNS